MQTSRDETRTARATIPRAAGSGGRGRRLPRAQASGDRGGISRWARPRSGQFWTRQFWTGALLALTAGAAGLGGCADPGPERPRNVILISVDTLRADRLGCYGAARETSPAIDALAARGVVFEDATATSPWTLPSHASLFTGLYPSRHGLFDQQHVLLDEARPLAETLREAGFATHAIVNALYVSERFGLGRGFDAYEYLSEWQVQSDGSRAIVNRGAEITDDALAYLKGVGESPFFLFLHYYDVHTDLDPDPTHRQAFAPEYEGAPSGRTDELLRIRRERRPLMPRDVQHLLGLYDAEVRTLDDQLGRLFAWLEASGRMEDTLVVLTSDHGEEWLEHGSLLHGRTYFQEVIAVPLIFAGAGVPAARRVRDPVSLVDVAPTIQALLGLGVDEGLDGRALQPLFTDAGAEPRVLFAEADHNNLFQGVKRNGLWCMAREGPWKLKLHRITGVHYLFHLERDPGETRDLKSVEPDKAAELLDGLRSFLEEERVARPVEDALLDEEERRRQQALGY